jgi:hypothetical protein
MSSACLSQTVASVPIFKPDGDTPRPRTIAPELNHRAMFDMAINQSQIVYEGRRHNNAAYQSFLYETTR